MTKIINMEVNSCIKCPYCDWYEPSCEYICSKVTEGEDTIHNQKILPNK